MKEIKNKYDYFIILIIASLVVGDAGIGALIKQRVIVGVFFLPFVIKSVIQYNSDFKIQPILLFLLAWFGYSVLSFLWTNDIRTAVTDVWIMFWNIILFLALYYSAFKANNPLQSVIRAWVTLVLFSFPIAFWEIVTDNHLETGSFNEGATIANELRTFAAVNFGNLNTYVTLLCSALPFLFAGILHNGRRLFSTIAILGTIVILFVNSSRGGIICLFVYSLLFILFYRKTEFRFKGIFTFFLIGGFLAFIYLFGDLFLEQFVRRMGTGYDSDFFSDDGRNGVLAYGWEICKESFFLGNGIGSMAESYAQTGFWLHYAHNFIMEFSIQYGFLIFVPFIILFVKCIIRLIKNEESVIRYIGYCVCIGFVFWMIIDDTYITRTYTWAYFASLAILATHYNLKSKITEQ